jgi:hypothetical protein
MSDGVGSWTPISTPAVPTASELGAAAEHWRRAGEDAGAALPEPLAAALQRALRLPGGSLDPVLGELPDADLDALARLYTLAEARDPAWEAGARSPVIAFFAELKARGADTAELASWIRAHSENRFLPHGSLQDRLRARPR